MPLNVRSISAFIGGKMSEYMAAPGHLSADAKFVLPSWFHMFCRSVLLSIPKLVCVMRTRWKKGPLSLAAADISPVFESRQHRPTPTRVGFRYNLS